MFYKFKKEKQKELIQNAIAKAGSERKLCKLLKIGKGHLYYLKFEKRNLSDKNASKICDFLQLNLREIEENILEKLPNDWGRKKGGQELIKKKLANGTFDIMIKKLNIASSEKMKAWHKHMKENETKKYYRWQYERFKKIGKGYTKKLKNGIYVRNLLEKKVGDLLIDNNIEFEYEPYLNIKGKAYFPDFLIDNNTILEVTEWRNPTSIKLAYLKNKIEKYQEEGYKVFLFIPQNIRNFYKEVNNVVISDFKDIRI